MPSPRPPRPFPDYLPNIIDSLMFLKLNNRTVQEVVGAVRFLGAVYIDELEVGVLKKTQRISVENLIVDNFEADKGSMNTLKLDGDEDKEYTLDVEGSVRFNFEQADNEKIVFANRPVIGADAAKLKYQDSFVTYKDVLDQGFIKKADLSKEFMPVESYDQPKVELKGNRLEFDYSVGEAGGIHFHDYPTVDINIPKEGIPDKGLVTAEFVKTRYLPLIIDGEIEIEVDEEKEEDCSITIYPTTSFVKHVTTGAVFDKNTPDNAFVTKECLASLTDAFLPLNLTKRTYIKTDNRSLLEIDPPTTFSAYVSCSARMVDDDHNHIPDNALITKEYVINNYVPSYIPEAHTIRGLNGTLTITPNIIFKNAIVNDNNEAFDFAMGTNANGCFTINSTVKNTNIRTGFYLDHLSKEIVLELGVDTVYRNDTGERRKIGYDLIQVPRPPGNKNDLISVFAVGVIEKEDDKIIPLYMIDDATYFAVPPHVTSEPTEDNQLVPKKYCDDSITNTEERLSEIYAKKVTEFGNIIKFLGRSTTIKPMNVGFQQLPGEEINEQSSGISFISDRSDNTGHFLRQVAADSPRYFLHSFLNEDSISLPATKTEVGSVYAGDGSKEYFTTIEEVENGEKVISSVEKIFTPDGEIRIDTYDESSNIIRSKQWKNFYANTTNSKYGIFSITNHDITFKQPGDPGLGANSIWDTIKLGFTAAGNVFNFVKCLAGVPNEETNVGLKVDIVNDIVYCGNGARSLTIDPDEILFNKDVYVEIPETNGLSKAMLVRGIMNARDDPVLFTNGGTTNFPWAAIGLGISAASSVFNLVKSIVKKNGATDFTDVGLKIDPINDVTTYGVNTNLIRISDSTISIGDEDHSTNDEKEIVLQRPTYIMCEVPGSNGLWEKLKAVAEKTWFGNVLKFFGFKGAADAVDVGFDVAKRVFNVGSYLTSDPVRMQIKPDLSSPAAILQTANNWINVGKNAIQIGKQGIETNGTTEIVLSGDAYTMQEVPDSNGLWEKLKLVAEKTWFGKVLKFFGFNGAADAVDIGYDVAKRVFNVGAYLSSSPIRMQLKPDLSSPEAILQTGRNWINIGKDVIQIGTDGITNANTDIIIRANNGNKILVNDTAIQLASGSSIDLAASTITLSTMPTVAVVPPIMYNNSLVTKEYVDSVIITGQYIPVNASLPVIASTTQYYQFNIGDGSNTFTIGNSYRNFQIQPGSDGLPYVTIGAFTKSGDAMSTIRFHQNMVTYGNPGYEEDYSSYELAVKKDLTTLLAKNNTFSGTNTFTQPIRSEGYISSHHGDILYVDNRNAVGGGDFRIVCFENAETETHGFHTQLQLQSKDFGGTLRIKLMTGGSSGKGIVSAILPSGRWITMAADPTMDNIEIVDNTPSNYPFQEFVTKNDCGNEYLERTEKIVLYRCYENNQLVYRWGVKNVLTNEVHPIL